MLQVNALGKVRDEAAFVFQHQGKAYLVPVGFEVTRPVFPPAEEDEANLKKKTTPTVRMAHEEVTDSRTPFRSGLHFTATIECTPSQPNRPVYVVTRSDDPITKRYVSDASATTAWRAALDDARTDFADREAELRIPVDAKGRRLVNGLRLYGLYFADVARAVRALPGAQAVLDAFPAVATHSQTSDVVEVCAAEAPAAPNPKKVSTRSTKAKALQEVTTTTHGRAAASPAASVPCPNCGLSDTPFCAATGKAHITACTTCGLTSAFCPVTGQPHEGAQRVNRKRGEVRLPSKTGSKRVRSSTGLTGTDGDVAEVSVIGTRDTDNGKKWKTEAVADATATGTSSAKRSRGGKAAAVAASAGGGARQRQATLLPVKKEEPPFAEILQEELFAYPTLRPPLSHAEQIKAEKLFLADWRDHPSPTVLLPAAAALPLPFVVRKRVSALAASRKKKGEEAHHPSALEGGDEDGDKYTGSSASPSLAPTKGMPQMVHPLEIPDVLNSVQGKRFTKYLIHYTSERSKLDRIRAATAVKSSGGGHSKSDEKPKLGTEMPLGTEEPEISPKKKLPAAVSALSISAS